MCNDPLSKIYLAKRMVPLHAIVVAFFDTVRAMYNIYNSDAFSKAAYNHEKITESWCYKERNEWHPVTCYTRGIEVKEGID